MKVELPSFLPVRLRTSHPPSLAHSTCSETVCPRTDRAFEREMEVSPYPRTGCTSDQSGWLRQRSWNLAISREKVILRIKRSNKIALAPNSLGLASSPEIKSKAGSSLNRSLRFSKRLSLQLMTAEEESERSLQNCWALWYSAFPYLIVYCLASLNLV